MSDSDKTKAQLLDELNALRQRAAQLEALADRYRRIADYTYDWEYWLQPDGQVAYVSPSCERITGYTPEEFLRDPALLTRIVYPDDQAQMTEHLARPIDAPADMLDFRIVTRDAEVHWISHACQPMYDAERQCMGRRISNRDITNLKQVEAQRQQAESARQHSEYLLSEAQRLAHLGSYDIDLVHHQTYWTAETYHILGLDPNHPALTTTEYVRYIHPEDVGAWQAMFEDALTRGIDFDLEYRIVRPSGEVRFIHSRGRPVTDPDGRVTNLIGTFMDFTERRHAAEALRQREAEQNALLAAMTDVVIVYDRAGRYLSIASTNAPTLFLAPEELVGHTISELLPTPAADTLLTGIQYALDQHQTTTVDYKLIINGQSYWFSGILSPLSDETVVLVARDITERKHAEDALRQSEQKFRSFVEQANVGIALVDVRGNIVAWNPAQELITGLAASQVLGQPVWEVQARCLPEERRRPDTLEKMRTGWQSTLNAQPTIVHPLRREVKIQALTGESRVVQEIGFPIASENNPMVGLIFTDITERRAVEHRYQLLFDRMIDGFALHEIICDESGHPIDYRFLEVNPAFEQITNRRAAELVGQTVLEVLPETEPFWIETFGRVALTGEAAQFEHYAAMLGKHFAIMAFSPHPGQFAAIYTDNTAEKHHVEELEAIAAISAALRTVDNREAVYPILVDYVRGAFSVEAVAVAAVDVPTGNIRVRKAAGEWVNWSEAVIPADAGLTALVIREGQLYLSDDVRADSDVSQPEIYGSAVAVACVPLITENRAIGALWIGRRSGARIQASEVRLLTAIAEIAANTLHRAEVLETLEQRVIDRTRELAHANERLTELDRLKSKFVSDVSHELRTPTTSLGLYLNLLENGKPEKREHYLATLKEQTARLSTLIEDILDLSRLDRERAMPRFAPVELTPIIQKAVTTHQPQAEGAGLQLIFETGPELPRVNGDAKQLTQVFVNLIANAVNYTRAGHIRVRSFREDDHVCTTIEDTGIGIDAEDLPHLFERFYRGRRTAQSTMLGSGLGLAIVKEILDVHRGTIDVHSTVGQGSTFTVRMPSA